MSLEPQNIPQLLQDRAAAGPDKIFLISEADKRQFTYSEFEALVRRVAGMLWANGVRKGDVISLLLPNSVEYVVAYFACWHLGALAGPINSLLKSQEIEYVISNSESKVLLVASEFEPRIENKNFIVFDDVGKVDAEPIEPARINCDDEAIIIYTSGTTGKRHGCLRTHGNVMGNARQLGTWRGCTGADRLVSMMSLFHMNPVSVATMSALYAGGSTVVTPKFSASRFWQSISDYQITSFGSVATMLSMLLSTYPNGVPEGLNTSRLRFAMCGSAPVPAEVMQRFEETFNCLVIEGYGLSESTCRSTFNPPDRRRRPGSCGLPIGNEMKVVDEEDRDVPDGELGEIVLRGENILKGYYKNDLATAEAFRNGWFHTGDIGYRDADGYFFIVDRKSDMIIRGGENIYPREIDEVLYQHPAVSAAAVIGVPDELYGEEVAAVVVLKPDAKTSEQEVIDFCKARLADYKCPKTVRFVEDIPKGPTGKLLKRELQQMFR